jgi:hypothetical protein
MSAFESTYVPAIMKRHTVGDRAASVVVEVAGLDISSVPMDRRYVAAYVSMSHLTTPRSVRTYTVLELMFNLQTGFRLVYHALRAKNHALLLKGVTTLEYGYRKENMSSERVTYQVIYLSRSSTSNRVSNANPVHSDFGDGRVNR